MFTSHPHKKNTKPWWFRWFHVCELAGFQWFSWSPKISRSTRVIAAKKNAPCSPRRWVNDLRQHSGESQTQKLRILSRTQPGANYSGNSITYSKLIANSYIYILSTYYLYIIYKLSIYYLYIFQKSELWLPWWLPSFKGHPVYAAATVGSPEFVRSRNQRPAAWPYMATATCDHGTLHQLVNLW